MSRERDHEECLHKLQWATHQLGLDVGEKELNSIADTIVQTMSGPWRYFHTPEHIFEVGGDEAPLEMLSALFHDLVYVQVDRSVNFNLSYYIAPYIREEEEDLVIRDRHALPDDPMVDLVMDIFGFEPGQPLFPYGGMNEFLSALAGAKILEPFCPLSVITQVVAIIEATIPFRPKNEQGQSNNDILFERLLKANDKYELGLSEAEIEATVKHSVRLSNRDVGSFANPSPARFLDNTWSLLPETNHNLKFSTSYTVHQYRIALQKMEGFMTGLDPEKIFHRFKDEPALEVYEQMVTQARSNMEVGLLYLGSKLSTIAFLEALSMRFGKDIPLSMLMGEMPTEGFAVSVLADFLPKPENPHKPRNIVEKEVLTLVEVGRLQEFEYDIKNSPLTTYMLKAIGFDEILRLRDLGKDLFSGEITGEDFLAECDSEVVDMVTTGLGKLFDSRKQAVHGIAPAHQKKTA
ncbi:MAG: hypothetical protein ACFCBU_17390 [Cyanophyceae cyanobacterium]